MASGAHVLPSFVQSFLDSKPPRLEWTENLYMRPELKSPPLFHERHLDAQLMLRRVRVIPLEHFLSEVVDHTLISLADKDISLHKLGPDGVFTKRLESEGTLGIANNAESVAKAYGDSTSQYCETLAPSLIFHPQARRLSARCLGWENMKYDYLPFAASIDYYGLQISPSHELSKNLRSFMDVATLKLVDELSERYRPLAWWETFCLNEETKTLFEEFEGIASADAFNGSCSTLGFRTPPAGNVIVSADALNIPWFTSICPARMRPDPPKVPDLKLASMKASTRTRGSSRVPLPRRSKKEKGKTYATPVVPKNDFDTTFWPEVQVAVANPESSHQLLSLFILRAWAQSVNDDTTFMIFRCGNYERIGFRHRESQTLFISGLIDIPNCDPTYNRIHTGLYLSILQDAIDRLKQRRAASEVKPKARKRKRDSCNVGAAARTYKTRSRTSKEDEEARNFELVAQHVTNRPLALITLRFGNYNSIAPAAFLRSGVSKKSTYGPEDYMSLVLTSKIGQGAIGSVYHAHMELLVDGHAQSTTVVVKVASQEKEVEGLRHEYKIYEHLSRKGVVDGIPFVFGLFKDTESEVTALVMNHVGTDLWDLRPDKTKEFVRVSKETEDTYVRILKSLHDADVVHEDIRPQNLMLKDDHPTIIDFTHARLDIEKDRKEAEIAELIEVLHEVPEIPREGSSMRPSSPLDELEDEDLIETENELVVSESY